VPQLLIKPINQVITQVSRFLSDLHKTWPDF